MYYIGSYNINDAIKETRLSVYQDDTDIQVTKVLYSIIYIMMLQIFQ
jgi:hypothetical protein